RSGESRDVRPEGAGLTDDGPLGATVGSELVELVLADDLRADAEELTVLRADDVVVIDVLEQVPRLPADVGEPHRPLRSDLPLEADRQRIGVRGVEVAIDLRDVDGGSGPGERRIVGAGVDRVRGPVGRERVEVEVGAYLAGDGSQEQAVVVAAPV